MSPLSPQPRSPAEFLPQAFLSLLRSLLIFAQHTHGLRRGLYSFAASRLPTEFRLDVKDDFAGGLGEQIPPWRCALSE